MTMFINVLITGLILSGIYSVMSVGLTLQYGVTKILNLAHGEFFVFGAFITLALTQLGISPIISLVLAPIPLFALGWVCHNTIYKRIHTISTNTAEYEKNSMLISYGIMITLGNAAIAFWGSGALSHRYQFLSQTVRVGDSAFAANRLVVLILAVAICFGYYMLLNRTRVGLSIRAVAMSPTTAAFSGIRNTRAMTLAFAIGATLAGLAGVLHSMINSIYTSDGSGAIITAIIIVLLGGLGSIRGSIIGGTILGFVAAIVSFQEPLLQFAAYYIIVIAILILRPRGLLGTR